MQYQRMQEDKQKAYQSAIKAVEGIKHIVNKTGDQLTNQGQSMDRLNNKLGKLEDKTKKTNNKM